MMRSLTTFTFSVLSCLSQHVHGDLISDLRSLNLSSSTYIGDPSNFTQRWSSYHAPSYSIGIRPGTDDDVAKIIHYASSSGKPFLTTGGGHGFTTTLGRLRDGIALDMSNFKKVIVNPEANTLTIGGAVRFRDVVGPLGRARKEIPIGSENCVGMVGATLGGGLSRYNGLHGMLVDSLLSVKVITADGRKITASNTENSDLFWGIRGAGCNFGTILEATYSIYDETAPLVLNADFLFPPNASQTILEYFKTLENNLPAELSFVLLAGRAAQLGGSFILVNAIYTGSQSEAMKYIQPLLNASPTRSNLTMIPWASVNSESFFSVQPPNYVCTTRTSHNVYGAAVKHIDVPTFQTFYENYESLLSSRPDELVGTVYFLELFPTQAVKTVPANATAYPWRDITAHLLFNFAYNDPFGELDRSINEFAREARSNFSAVSGFEQPQLYVSYGHGDENLETLYSAENLPRLRELKAKWDPKNVYRFSYPLVS